MMNDRKKGKYIGMAGALLVHLAIIALLVLIGIAIPEREEESGVEVMMGSVADAYGGFEPSSLVNVDITTQPEATADELPAPTSEQDLITQTEEETVAVEPESPKKEEQPKPEKTEAEKQAEARRLAEEKVERERRAAEEAKRLAEEKAERERQAAAEAAAKLVAGAFGKGAEMENSGTTEGTGQQGSPTGNAPTGASDGASGYGTFDLSGRSIGAGGLPRPVYNVKDEGRVVVSITVNPAGHVIATSIDRQTNTVNAALRKAAEEAAKKARFNAVDGVNNQVGTITYYFNLK